MRETSSQSPVSIPRLIFIPAVISLAVTLLRLVGELQHWNEWWFNREPGGGGSPLGISWLALLFGVYFGAKLTDAGEGPKSAARVIIMAVVGVLIVIGGTLLIGGSPTTNLQFAVVFLSMIVAAVIQYPAWPKLFKTLLAYGYAARIPVAIIMYFAIRGRWGTHYDVLPNDQFVDSGVWSTYLQIGLLPQMILWPAFTVIAGALFGGIASAIIGKTRRQASQAASA